MDLVPNHTSDQHAWFRESRSSRDNPKRDWYVWRDEPNNWVSAFFGPAWELDETTGQYYLHNFLVEQPDLDWWNPEVRDAFDDILRFWFDRGVAGFRIDVAHMIIKDRELRDNPPATEEDGIDDQLRGQRSEHNTRQPEVHDVHKRFRRVADEYDPPRMLVGETFLPTVDDIIPFYGEGDELNLAFNIPFVQAPFEADALRSVIERTEHLMPPGCTPVWTGSNHDVSRFPTRWGGNDPGRARCALMMLLTLRGCVFLYQGDELGLVDTEVPREELQDPVGIQFYPVYGRDPERTPMPWNADPGAGFTEPGVTPWLRFGELPGANVADQRGDPDSFLSLTRDLIGLRDAVPELRAGAYASLDDAPDGVLAYRRGDRVLVALNIGDAAATVEDVRGLVRIGTVRSRDQERVDGTLRLASGEGVVVWLDGEPTRTF
jgi:alpha-glucosidase